MREIERQVLSFTNITAGQTGDIRPLPIGITAVRYKLRWTATYTQSATAGALQPDSPYGFLKNVQLQLGGGFPLRNHDGRFLKFWNFVQRFGVANRFVAPAVTANAVTNIVAELTVDLFQPDMIPPLSQAFVLDTRLLSGLALVFDWGVIGDIATNGSTITPIQMVVTSCEAADVSGPSSRQQISKQLVQTASITANGFFDVPITAQGPAYRALVFSFRSGATDPNDAAGDDTFASTLSLIADNAVRYYDQAPYVQIQQENIQTYSAQGTWPAGYAFFDFAKAQNLTNLLLTQLRKQLVARIVFGSSIPANAWVLVYPINDILVVKRPVAATGKQRVFSLAARR